MRRPAPPPVCERCGFAPGGWGKGLGSHVGSKKCAAMAEHRGFAQRGLAPLPRAFRWAFAPVGVPFEIGICVEGKAGEQKRSIWVQPWVAQVMKFGSADDKIDTSEGGWAQPLSTFDVRLEVRLPFVKAAMVEPELVEALAAAVRLGGAKAGATFVADHKSYVAAFRGGKP